MKKANIRIGILILIIFIIGLGVKFQWFKSEKLEHKKLGSHVVFTLNIKMMKYFGEVVLYLKL
ncbi:hypothetical protein Q5M85_03820 [Paraclostridium bifermentans]|nr:hypothetical protein [Paraclostridium bifermentans]